MGRFCSEIMPMIEEVWRPCLYDQAKPRTVVLQPWFGSLYQARDQPFD